PNNTNTASMVTDLQAAAVTIGRQLEVLSAGTNREIDTAFASFAQKRLDALLVSPEALFISRRVQLVTAAIRYEVPAIYPLRGGAEAGALMRYGPNFTYILLQVGIYTGRILKMLWGGSREHISIAALTNAMEPRDDETQIQDCERFQPVSRPVGYGRDVDRG